MKQLYLKSVRYWDSPDFPIFQLQAALVLIYAPCHWTSQRFLRWNVTACVSHLADQYKTNDDSVEFPTSGPALRQCTVNISAYAILSSATNQLQTYWSFSSRSQAFIPEKCFAMRWMKNASQKINQDVLNSSSVAGCFGLWLLYQTWATKRHRICPHCSCLHVTLG